MRAKKKELLWFENVLAEIPIKVGERVVEEGLEEAVVDLSGAEREDWCRVCVCVLASVLSVRVPIEDGRLTDFGHGRAEPVRFGPI